MDVNDRVFRTYEGWKKRGRCVRWGERAVAFVGNNALFGKDQTGKVPQHRGNIYEHGSEYGSDSYYGSGGVDHNGYY